MSPSMQLSCGWGVALHNLHKTDEDMRTAVRYLASEKRVRNKKQIKHFEPNLGVRYVLSGMLLEKALDLKPAAHDA